MLATALLAACAAGMPTQVSNGALVGPNGMTLYTFDKDVAGSGKSTCNDQCAKNWPPLNAVGMDSANGNYTIITRDDGSKHWALTWCKTPSSVLWENGAYGSGKGICVPGFFPSCTTCTLTG